ncbi:MAG: hypothetical protein JWQ72_568 [Polaromonas sp.]|nr:hypothetical protein [Polaromonas sp.]
MPESHAPGFLEFCRLNPAACPVLGVGEPGQPAMPSLAGELDLRTDLPGYLVHAAGAPPQEVGDIGGLWRTDWVAVAIGCWFSMEDALASAGVRLRHAELGIQGPLFKTAIAAQPSGIFAGPLVVSMRPFAQAEVNTVREITRRFSRVHGAPMHEGDPGALGITDLGRPDFGEVMDVLPGELPLYWPCGLTALVALQQAGLPLFITHAPGKMLVTDCLNASLETA